MPVYPRVYENVDIDPSGKYKCPLCIVQTTGDAEDIGWVHCPLLNDRPICRGCCMDYQATAVSADFETHPYRDLFDDLARMTNLEVGMLRRICLEHQEVCAERTIFNVSGSDTIKDELLRDHLLQNLQSDLSGIGAALSSLEE